MASNQNIIFQDLCCIILWAWIQVLLQLISYLVLCLSSPIPADPNFSSKIPANFILSFRCAQYVGEQQRYLLWLSTAKRLCKPTIPASPLDTIPLIPLLSAAAASKHSNTLSATGIHRFAAASSSSSDELLSATTDGHPGYFLLPPPDCLYAGKFNFTFRPSAFNFTPVLALLALLAIPESGNNVGLNFYELRHRTHLRN